MRPPRHLTVISLGGGVQSSVMALMASESLLQTGSATAFRTVLSSRISIYSHLAWLACQGRRLRRRRRCHTSSRQHPPSTDGRIPLPSISHLLVASLPDGHVVVHPGKRRNVHLSRLGPAGFQMAEEPISSGTSTLRVAAGQSAISGHTIIRVYSGPYCSTASTPVRASTMPYSFGRSPSQ